MSKKVVLVIILALLTVTGLATGCGMKEEPKETENKAVEKQENNELAEDYADKTVIATVTKGMTQIAEKVDVTEEKVYETKEKAADKAQNPPVIIEDKHQEEHVDSANEVTEKPKQEERVEVEEPPKHTHSWEPVYSERQIEKTRQIPWTKCYACGADMTGNVHHIDEHLLNGDSNVHYGTEYREEIYYETESYASGYKCLCGATK